MNLGRKRRLKERGLTTLPKVNQMTQVTYRGVKYDSDEYREAVHAAAKQRNFDLMYRGIKVAKKLVAA